MGRTVQSWAAASHRPSECNARLGTAAGSDTRHLSGLVIGQPATCRPPVAQATVCVGGWAATVRTPVLSGVTGTFDSHFATSNSSNDPGERWTGSPKPTATRPGVTAARPRTVRFVAAD